MSEHEVLTFLRVQCALERMKRKSDKSGMRVKSTGPLAEALGQLGCLPYVKIPCDSFDVDCELSIGGKLAGTFGKPDVDAILQESTASSFGKGETTVLDPAYRHGKEIAASNMVIKAGQSYRHFSHIVEDEISTAMFVGKTVKLKFYKLAVYEEGGHFDWHMDTTHSDQHHATFLLALNTSWEGGDLKLRRNGVVTSVNMHPKPDREGEGISLRGAAFYTDTEHKVEPVTKGTRIVLQYDVEVVDGKAMDENEDDDDYETEEEGEKNPLEDVEGISRKRKRFHQSSCSVTADEAILTKVTDIIARLLTDGQEEVAFAMQHLYRKSSILPEFLKGPDAQLYRALVKSFEVTLRPVVLQSRSDYEGLPESCVGITWDPSESKPDSKSDPDLKPGSKPETGESDGAGSMDDESDFESEDDETGVDSKTKRKGTFHLPKVSAIERISYQSYIEYTGNSAQPEEMQYFGGGMFVRQKEVAKKQ